MKIKNYCIVILASLLAFISNHIHVLPVKAENNLTQRADIDDSKINMAIEKDSNWKQLTKLWKMMNHLESNKNAKMIDKLYTEYDKLPGLLNALEEKKLLTSDQKDFLKLTFDERKHFLMAHYGFLSCYGIPPQESKVLFNRIDLEKRYDELEKLYNDNRLDQTSYQLVKNNIMVNLVKIEKRSLLARLDSPNLTENKPKKVPGFKSKTKDNYADLLILLNK